MGLQFLRRNRRALVRAATRNPCTSASTPTCRLPPYLLPSAGLPVRFGLPSAPFSLGASTARSSQRPQQDVIQQAQQADCVAQQRVEGPSTAAFSVKRVVGKAAVTVVAHCYGGNGGYKGLAPHIVSRAIGSYCPWHRGRESFRFEFVAVLPVVRPPVLSSAVNDAGLSIGSVACAASAAPRSFDCTFGSDSGSTGQWRSRSSSSSSSSTQSGDGSKQAGEKRGGGGGRGADLQEISHILSIVALVKAFRDRGHLVANLDPLGRALGPLKDNSADISLACTSRSSAESKGEGIAPPGESKNGVGSGQMARTAPHEAEDLFDLLKDYPALNLDAVGLGGVDPKKRFFLGGQLRVVRATQLFWTVEEVVALLRHAYCGTSTAEYAHLSSKEQKQWMHAALERPLTRPLFSPAQQRTHLRHLLYADAFEGFLGRKFPSSKRFGIEGAESLIPGLHWLLQHAAKCGVQSVELGMAHRGRLSVLHAVLGKPLGSILAEFKTPKPSANASAAKNGGASGRVEHEELLHVGDVKYHLGTRSTLRYGGNKSVQVSLSPNPSHLEAVDPVVVGKTRAKQLFTGDTNRTRTMGLLLHGDAAFSGLGLAPEVLQLSELPEYTTGGTVHLIINNQIGFTTDPKLARSSPHPSDFAKAVGAPIFHVNGDDPEAVAHMCQLAVDWRQRFHKDVVVDIVCYRRHGHNEQDDPSVTQPLMYRHISQHPTTLQLYTQHLTSQGVVSTETVEWWREDLDELFEREMADVGQFRPTAQDWLAANWQGHALGSLIARRNLQPTGMPLRTLQRVGEAICRVPPSFDLHPHVAALLSERVRSLTTGHGINWATAEALAFGSLLLPADATLKQTPESNPAHPVRLSGQDCERGTFNQRHAVLHDQTSGRRYTPLAHMEADQAPFVVCNSSLSEAAVLGFEYGFSLENENALVMWEAQFGDFANNAQSMVDNFVASGEDKWMTPTGLVLLLPHGYDGQGPDHSSARVERFLQMCNDDADHLPGFSPRYAAEIDAGFNAADRDGKGYLTEDDLVAAHASIVSSSGGGSDAANEASWAAAVQEWSPHAHSRSHSTRMMMPPVDVRTLMHELGVPSQDHSQPLIIRCHEWKQLMVRWMRRNAEADNNMCVVNLSTPANYFHVLRRQVNRHFSKPLIVVAPKFLLHHRACSSPLSHFTSQTTFSPVILDGDPSDNWSIEQQPHVNADDCDHNVHLHLSPDLLPPKLRKVANSSSSSSRSRDKGSAAAASSSAAAAGGGGGGAKGFELLPPEERRRLILCSGKVFYVLAHARRAKGASDIGILRIEQIAPLAVDLIADAIDRHPRAELVWVQEEPKNMGAWSYVYPRLLTILRTLCAPRCVSNSTSGVDPTSIRFIGREPSASTATGSFQIHQMQTRALVEAALA